MSLEFDAGDPDHQTLLFQYPHSSLLGNSAYILPVVKIELGARSDHWPSQDAEVVSYVAEEFPQIFDVIQCRLRVLSARRTFWEKAIILHAEYHREENSTLPPRLSRHYYDLCQLMEAGIGSEASRDAELLRHVARHKGIFFRSAWANYESAKKGTLKLTPRNFRRRELERDYEAMQEMFFTAPPSFEEVIAAIDAFEREFNTQL